jgi:hypothetical protein
MDLPPSRERAVRSKYTLYHGAGGWGGEGVSGMKFHYKGHWKGWALKIKTFLGPEMATSNTHVHKITNVPVFIYGA